MRQTAEAGNLNIYSVLELKKFLVKKDIDALGMKKPACIKAVEHYFGL